MVLRFPIEYGRNWWSFHAGKGPDLSLDLVFWIGGLLVECVLLAVLFRKRVFRQLPFFCVFIAWNLLSDTGLFVLQRWIVPWGSNRFFHLYEVQMAIDSTLIFALLVELSWSVLRPIRSSLPRGGWIGIALLVALAGLAVWPLAGMTQPPELSNEGSAFFRLDQTAAILRVVIFLAMAGFSQLLSLNWRNRELQVATGLGFYSIVSLAVTIVHTHQAVGSTYHIIDQLQALCYLGSLSYWVLAFTTKEAERQKFSPQMEKFLLLVGSNARASRTQVTSFMITGSQPKDKQ
jgi:hypothetical protein